MTARFLHTADWQLGKPFAGVADEQKRALLRQQRFDAVRRMGEVVRETGAAFVVVAGDLFDSPTPDKATVSAACSAIGSLGVPVYAIPGNHDHGGAGSLWEQEFFRREQAALAPNFRILLEAKPVDAPGAVLFPCPLLRRHEAADPTAWLRSAADWNALAGDKPRIVLAHGSVQQFGTPLADEEEGEAAGSNLLDLKRLEMAELDYLALGDWHGTKQVEPKAWYSGTPELDRFVKGEDHRPGQVLAVEAARSRPPQVREIRTAAVGWHALSFRLAEAADVPRLQQMVETAIGTRVNGDLMRLELSGSLDLAAAAELEQMLEAWTARLLRVKLINQTVLAPSEAELESLTRHPGAPLISRVAGRLSELALSSGETAAVARLALRELHAAAVKP
ncbi:MAG: DNA repair exonuclease [Verrucomicrobiales bacterium]|nr:DNA repair exonuclease [Verrucomicrobiales bacterium]